jgi:hypothetical protein
MKRVLESYIIGKGPVGKPRKRWVNAVEIDNRGFESEDWKKGSVDRQIWRRRLKEAKA